MIIAWWNIEHEKVINLSKKDSVPWLTANWVAWRPASEIEIEMYEKGITIYKIYKKND